MYQVTGHLYHLQWQWATIKKIENASKEKKRVTLSFSLSRVKIGYYSICRSISRTYQLNGDVWNVMTLLKCAVPEFLLQLLLLL